MANVVSGFYQTVVAAATEASAVLAYNRKAVESIYWDFRPEQVGTLGQTINIVVPGTRTPTDIGVGSLVITDTAETTVPIVFNKHPEDAILIRDFEQYNTPADLRRLFMDSAIKGISEYINAQVTGLLTTGNFTSNTAIATTGGVITTTQFLAGQATLSDAKVPVYDMENMSLLLPSVGYTKMSDPANTAGANWVQAQIAGNLVADKVRTTGEFGTAYGTTVKLDQQVPVTGSVGTRTWTAALIHRYAIAGVTRPLPTPPPDIAKVEVMFIMFGGVPIRVMLSWSHTSLGCILSVDAGFGLAVVRPYMGQLFTIAE